MCNQNKLTIRGGPHTDYLIKSNFAKGRIILVDPIPTKKDADITVRNSADFTTGSPVAVREPIAIEHIGAYLQASGYRATILAQGSKSNDDIAAMIERENPLLVGLSMHSTYLYLHTRDLAGKIKERLPSVPIVVGGYHPSGCLDILRDRNIDFVVVGEGEETLKELVDKITRAEGAELVKGLAYFQGDKLVLNPPRPRLDFASLPWALRDQEILKDSKCTPLAYPAPPAQTSAAQIAYSRGCPHLCDFCASPLIWGSKLSYRRPGDVVDEIEYLQKKFGTNFLFFNDLSFNVNKPRAINLCEEMIKRLKDIYWFAYTTIYGMDYETAKMMRNAGCTRLGFGIESVLDATLDRIKPKQNLSVIRDVLEMTSNLGMLNRCYMLIGWPWESKQTLDETTKIMKVLKMDQLRLCFVMPFPGTKFYDESLARIERPFEEFSGDTPVMSSAYITIDELKTASSEMLAAFYRSDEYQKHVDEKIRMYPHLKDTFDYFFSYLKRHDILS